jgi:hypothetical protein
VGKSRSVQISFRIFCIRCGLQLYRYGLKPGIEAGRHNIAVCVCVIAKIEI